MKRGHRYSVFSDKTADQKGYEQALIQRERSKVEAGGR
jgi:hypothetical protein